MPPPYTVRFSWRATTRRAQRPGRAGVVAPHADGASRMPRPTSSAPFVGADVLIGPRAATWGRPYENFDPLCPVGADLRVRPPVLGAHIGAPLHGGGQVAPSSGLAGHLPPQGEGPARPGGRPYKETGAISPPVSLRSTAPSSEGAKENTPRKKPPSDEGGGICGANDGGRDRAARASPRLHNPHHP